MQLDPKHKYSSHLEFVPQLVKQFNAHKMAEIGVLYGALSKSILSNCPSIISYYLIDPWKPFLNPPAHTQQEWNKRYNKVKKMMLQFKDKPHILRLTSLEAAKQFKPESLDIVYIDAIHSFKYVDNDIKTWWPKIRKTGCLAGHDLIKRWHGVQEAIEFNFNKQYQCGQPSSNWDGSWFVRKSDFI